MPPTHRPIKLCGTVHNMNTTHHDMWRTSTLLHTTTAHVENQPVCVMFDEGSQLNVISTAVVERLALQTSVLQKSQSVRYPNNQGDTITHYVPAVTITFSAIRLDAQPVRLYFRMPLLVLNTHVELLLGVPFLRYWNIVSHHCNGTLVFTGNTGHHAIIPLHQTRVKRACNTKYCPIAQLKEPTVPIPNSIPWVPRVDGEHLDIAVTRVCSPDIPTVGMIAISDDSPIELVSARDFARVAKASEAAVYVCVFRSVNWQNDTRCITNTCCDTFAQQIKDLALKKFPRLFPDSLPRELPPRDCLHHPIDLVPAYRIPQRKLYCQSENELKETKRQINEYLEAGHIRPSSSSFGAPVLLVKKKDGSMRMCIDYRSLNDITVKNTFLLPRIDDLHDRLGKAYYFTKLDLYSGYHQIPIRIGDEHKTAFTSRYGTYEFLVMPFGLTNAPATFQTAMTDLFRDWLDDFVIVYLDDILIYSATPEQHRNHVTLVLKRLEEHQWYCKLKKCAFATSSVEYLGHIVEKGQIAIDPDKMKAVAAWPTPFRNVTEVQSFLGLVGYYRKFIHHFSHMARHLNELTHKNVEFKWQDKHTEAVKSLKQAILSYDCLVIFNSELQTTLTTDACDYALGAVLMQTHPQGERPIAFISCTLNSAECNYSMWEKELFAIVWAIKYFRPYLLGHQFVVKSDNKPSTQLLTNSAMKLSTSATNRVIRWILSIQAYNFKVEHQPGKTNVVADALSRFAAHINVIPQDQEIASFCQTQTTPATDTRLFKIFQETYKKQPACADIVKLLNDGQYHPRFMLYNQILVTRESPFRVLVPDDP